LSTDVSQLTPEKIRHFLSDAPAVKPFDEQIGKIRIKFPILKPAAVLMPLFEAHGEWHLLFTRRADTLVDHKGQVSFPGGTREEGDPDLAFTALRETYEEIGVKPTDITLLGALPPRELITGYLVTPFVGRVPWPYPLKISIEEVVRVFSMPLNWLIDEDNRYLKRQFYLGQKFQVLYYKLYDGETLWGASASMTLELLDMLRLNGHVR
jgi:8-oxo-dGTP pyrophosphatase MutT (NUDIX family)